jgi:uncharacterized protein YjbI with pentapeptide repeats
MANLEHLEILAMGVAEWNRWRELNFGVTHDLDRAILTNRDLNGINMLAANLTGAKLQGSILDDANLLGANLTKASLRGARLQKANLARTVLASVSPSADKPYTTSSLGVSWWTAECVCLARGSR